MQEVKGQAVRIAKTQLRPVRRVPLCMASPITNAPSDFERRTATDKHFVPTWVLLFGLLLGIVASVVGYIGCFSVVQSSQRSTGPISWLCLEAALSLLRMSIWSLNPQSDDAPPLEFILALDDEPPLPTCNQYSEDIDADKVLPLTRADQFLNSVTSFTGLIDRFRHPDHPDHPDLTLYYALTRKRARNIEPETTLGEWVLYIAVVNHKERTARVHTRGETSNGFCAIESSIPAVDLEHDILETKLGKIVDIKHDPIVGVDGIPTLLEKHHQSIMGPYSTITNTAEDHIYHIKNGWTMKRADTTSAVHKKRITTASGRRASTVQPSQEATMRDTSKRDHQYLEQGPMEKMLGNLYMHRGKWVENYMTLVMRETRERFAGRGTVRRVDGDAGGGKKKSIGGGLLASESDAKSIDRERVEMEKLLITEWCLMEMLLVYEVERWEEQLWERRRRFVGGSPEKERLTKEWRGNAWKRLDANIRAMNARIDTAKPTANSKELHVSLKWLETHEHIQQAWRAVVKRFMDRGTLSSSPSMTLQRLEGDLGEITEPLRWRLDDGLSVQRLENQREEMASHLRRELEDVKERLHQGLERCDQFWSDELLVECRRSHSKTLTLQKLRLTAPLEVYSRALKQNKAPTHIIFFDFDSDDDCQWIADTIRDLPSVTSIWVTDGERLPAIDRTIPLFIGDYDIQDIKPFLQNDPQLARCQDTFIFVTRDAIAVSFVGPTSGDLILRLRHRSTTDSTKLRVRGTSFSLSLSSSLTIDDITLHARPCSESDKPSFERGVRNNLIILVFRWSYSVDDILLLDQTGNRYDAASQSLEGVSVARCVTVLLSCMIDKLQPLIRRVYCSH